ncbi:DUF2790 domain-containing protein [Pseudomonas sp. RTC3]|uniref:DUF2790 domain-containing protein n=1 Tax=unclassified Pseudomonas TaxID=196821 RepID=UPI002AB5202C|nr:MULTISPECIES: DUF2790 domain-containing protein [unclassified Pseudomonas]MEB0064291.1 DUF2790 domain-containing protein [Pseudomonas sp. RTC3]MDY7567468.1 DUF2790 domain-containing protein [Pseudomonas sp. 5C2]MEB0006563.1 DUF2790 domain-containing protein [Pseudomonas sp. RTB2]MEB0017339.1 DUF2790 domain-containing protein [Pseudomonas sp. RTB3]MEB0026358.1 DUF2790 domain-containing protein [Pseudomonas sp. MH9.2]
MKSLIVLALVGFSSIAAAGEVQAVNNPAVEQYTYATELDVAKVISMDSVPDTCGVVPVQMTYEDHQGQRHTLQYSVMGNGCSNG